MTDKIVIILYLIVMTSAGYIGVKHSKSGTDFALAGRRLGPFMYTSAMSTVILGGTATVGGVSLGYQYGISGMMLVLMFSAGIAMIGLLFAGKLFRADVCTVPEALERRYGSMPRLMGAVIVVAYSVLVGATQIVAMRTVLEVVFDIPPTAAAFVGWIVVVVYSVAGGMWSITLTDVLQFTIKSVGIFLILLPLTVLNAGGIGGMREALPESFFSMTAIGWGTIGSYFLLFFFGFMVDQGNWQRLATARSVGVARWGAVTAGIYCALYGAAGALIGAAARVLMPALDTPDNAYAAAAALVLPAGVLGVVMAAAVAATMSTASGLLIGASTVLTRDVLRPLWGRPHDRGQPEPHRAVRQLCRLARHRARGRQHRRDRHRRRRHPGRRGLRAGHRRAVHAPLGHGRRRRLHRRRHGRVRHLHVHLRPLRERAGAVRHARQLPGLRHRLGGHAQASGGRLRRPPASRRPHGRPRAGARARPRAHPLTRPPCETSSTERTS
ncbi:Na+/pantothenate symporter [Kineosphaera limosa]|uniref:Putative sodium/solute symporter n=1 Tax=Kineosphaera limosa NBRC 100340 TaxID=1184609 RepID=K6WZ24_9MICO|nr:putative sodium/solute symporter [Kineosphaera limosa]NYE01781.1 Na+/pantothenate symporter [Kineosphaera limosa]GAB97332.1 putative sodium/solute symporter [Kineosphaera limosa NBRC 100340]